jgi:hypothetical protein
MSGGLRGKLPSQGDTLARPSTSSRRETPPLAPLGLLVDELVIKMATEQCISFSTGIRDIDPLVGASPSLVSRKKHEKATDTQLGQHLRPEGSNNGSASENKSVHSLQGGQAASFQTEKENDVTNENFKNIT